MKINFKSSLVLLLSWLLLIFGAGSISALIALKLAEKSLATVDKANIMKRQSSRKSLDGNHPKIMAESEILKQINHYLEREP